MSPRVIPTTILLTFSMLLQQAAYAAETLPEAEVTSKIVILPSYAQVHQPTEAPSLLAFSPDNTALAYTTHKFMAMEEHGEFWASQLHWLPLAPIGNAKTLVDANSTAKFGFYGAPALDLAWEHNTIRFIIGNGDDEATEIRYLATEQRLENPNIGANTIDQPISPSKEQIMVAKCLPELPEAQVSALIVSWLKPEETALYQLNYANSSEDIAVLNVQTCRQQSLAVPVYNAEGVQLSYRLIGGALQDAQLLVILDSRFTTHRYNHQHPSQTMILQTNIHTLGSPTIEWQNWSYGLGGNHRFELLSQQPNKTLFMLTQNGNECSARLFSLSHHQFTSFMIDQFKLCNAAVSTNGQLALNLARSNHVAAKKINSDKPHEHAMKDGTSNPPPHNQQIWVVKSGFLNHLVK